MKLRLTPAAAGDIRKIYDYLAEESPAASVGFEHRLAHVFARIRQHPYTGRPSDRNLVRITITHPYPYLVFYRIRPGEIVILRVRHGARDPKTMPAGTR